MAIDKFIDFNASKIHDEIEDSRFDVERYIDSVSKSFRNSSKLNNRRTSLKNFNIGQTYKVISLKSVPQIEQEIEVVDKNHRIITMQIIFKKLGYSNNVKMWVDPSNFEIVPEKQHVKWYSKGKFKDEEDWVNESESGERLFKATMLALSNFKVGDSCSIKNSLIYLYAKKERLKKYAGLESKIINKGNSEVKVEFPDGVTDWLCPLSLNKIVPKQHVKWYSKGRFSQDEEWIGESNEDSINLSYKLKDIVGFRALMNDPKIDEMKIYDTLIRTAENTFSRYFFTGKKMEILSKKSRTLFGKYIDEKIYNIEITSLHTNLDGEIIFIGREEDGISMFYKSDLIRCAEKPDEYPIYIKKPKITHNVNDPYGEEDWGID